MGLDVNPVGDVHVVSVHDEDESIHFSIPSVVPSRYDIPGINAAKEIFDACKFSLPGQARPVKYAVRRTLNNRPYVLVRIVEPNTFIYGTEQQKVDEYGQRLSPDVMRVPVPVRAELIANEIERAHGNMGLKAIRGPVTPEILDEVLRRNIAFLRGTVNQTTVWAAKNPNNVTAQARRRAWALHKMGQLDVMPTWAVLDPDAVGSANRMFNCVNCSKLIRKETNWCECGAIYNWKAAVELGKVKPSDVPPSKRAEAGLEGYGDPIAVSTAPAPQSAPVTPAAPEVDDDPLPPVDLGQDEADAQAGEPDPFSDDESSDEDATDEELANLDGDASVSAADLRSIASRMAKE